MSTIPNWDSHIVAVLNAKGEIVGTGFVANERLILTCAHVVKAAGAHKGETLKVAFRINRETIEVLIDPELWASPETEDIAVLRLPGPLPVDVSPIRFGTTGGVGGHSFTTFGYPTVSELDGLPSSGEIVGKTTIRNIGVLSLRSQEVTPGFSGAPVWDNLTRRIVGMVVSITPSDAYKRLAATAFAITSEIIQATCPELLLSDFCPYRSLDAFTEKDAEFFFGRQSVVDRLLESLKQEPRFLAVLGPSGCGKSSIVRAGLIPQIRQGKVPGGDKWGIIVARPADQPFEQFDAEGLKGATESLLTATRAWLYEHPDQSRLVVVMDQFEELLTITPEFVRQKFVAQITEVLESALPTTFILTLRDDFYGNLAHQASSIMPWVERGLVNVPLTIEQYDLLTIIEHPAKTIGLIFEPGLSQVILNDVMESSPVDKQGPSTILPLLEFALTQLWERRQDGVLTHHIYQNIGSVTGGLTQWADNTYYSFSENERNLARRILTDLVHLGNEQEGVPDSRRRLYLSNLVRSMDESETIHAIVQKLADARLLITSEESQSKQVLVEIIHDALVREWKLLCDWVENNRRFLVWRQSIEESVKKWIETNPTQPGLRDEGRLLRGHDLAIADGWLIERGDDLSQSEWEFIQTSQKLRKREATEREIQYQRELRLERERASALRRIIYLGFILFITVLSSILVGLLAYRVSTSSKISFSNQLAALAISHQESQIDLAYLLSVESYRAIENFAESETFIPRNNLLSILGRSPYMSQILQGHHDKVLNIAFHPQEGDILTSAGADGWIRLWQRTTNETTQKPIWEVHGEPIENHNGAIWDIVFSPDGKTLVTGNEDSTITIWKDITSAHPISETVDQHTNDVYAVVIDSKGKYLASGSRDNSIVVWDLATGKHLTQLSSKPGNKHTLLGVTSLTFNPQGTLLASGGGDSRIFLWDTSTWITATWNLPPNPITRIEGDNGQIWSLSFTPDGKKLIAGTSFNRILIWDVNKLMAYSGKDALKPEKTLVGHKGSVYSMVFSPDKTKMASASKDGTVLLWDTSDWRPISQFLGHSRTVTSVDFNTSGNLLASGSNDKNAIIWDIPKLAKHIPQGENSRITGTTVDLNRNIVASATQKIEALGEETTIQNQIIFRIGDSGDRIGASILMSDTITHTLTSLAFSPDGKILAVGSQDKRLYAWEVSGDNPEAIFEQMDLHSDTVSSLVFNPNGQVLATGSCKKRDKKGEVCLQGEVLLWKVADWEKLGEPFLENRDNISSLAFSPYGEWLASGSCSGYDPTGFCNSGEIYLRDLSASIPDAYHLTGQSGMIESLAFSPDGKILASGSCGQGDRDTGCTQGEIRLWDLDKMELSGQPIYGHLGAVTSLGFNPAGNLLVSTGVDTSIIIWDIQNRQPTNIPFIGHSDRITMISFSPDGKTLYTGSWDGTIMSQPVNTDIAPLLWLDMACQRAGRNLTQAEWDIYLPGRTYRKTCPQWPEGQ